MAECGSNLAQPWTEGQTIGKYRSFSENSQSELTSFNLATTTTLSQVRQSSPRFQGTLASNIQSFYRVANNTWVRPLFESISRFAVLTKMVLPALGRPPQQRKKPGKTSAALSDRIYRPKRVAPIKRLQKNRSRNRKIEVLMWMYHHRVVLERREGVSQLPRVLIGLEITSERMLNGTTIFYRPPTYAETSAFWKVLRNAPLGRTWDTSGTHLKPIPG